jgi:cell division protein FtsZ
MAHTTDTSDMSDKPASDLARMKPRIVVMGVGGGGGNAVNNMLSAGLVGPKFMVANTDAQALAASAAEHRIQLGAGLTEGIGAGAKHEVGEAAAEESLEDIRAALTGAHMVFIAAGMGGGTGTGATPVIARVARELGILTVAVVTKPFLFEGKRRMRTAEAGIAELRRHVDTLIVIPNQNLFRIADERTPFAEAFVLADQVLYAGVACIVDLVVRDALINLDLADVRTVLSGMGTAMMGTGEASGENRALTAAKDAIFNPLLDDVSLKGARSLLVAIGGGQDLTLFEVHDAIDCVRQELDPDANIIFGATLDDNLTGRIRVSVVASGMDRAETQASRAAGRSQSGFFGPAALAQDRSSEAKGPTPNGPAAAHSRGLWVARPESGRGKSPDARPPADPPRRSSSGQRAQRDAAPNDPGEVVIREGPPQLSGQYHEGYGRAARREEEHAPGRRISPGERTSRPMPTVEDFPLVGQREYWAKTARGRAEPQPPAPPEGRKSSLLQRLTGRGSDRRSNTPATAERPADETLDLPVFFRREQGS